MKPAVLIPINFREDDANVITYGVAVAQSLNTKAKLLYVLTRPGIPAPVEVHAGSLPYHSATGELLDKQIQQAEKKLASIAQTIREEKGIQTQYLCKLGFVDTQILDISELEQTEMVVMGAPHNMSFLNQLIGSRSYKVVKQAAVPVLIIPLLASYQSIDNVVVGVDYTQWDDDKHQWLKEFTNANRAVLHYVRIVPQNSSDEKLAFNGFEKRIVSEASSYKLRPQARLMINKNIEEGLREYLQTIQASVIAIQRSNKTFWEHLFSENLTKELVFSSEIPVLIY